ncbi:MAG: helix-turn-helix transcriptional regulator [Lachnospiraceae bacterium]|nr:helix-turn-helix transcriptional regulator [Lachnospiraceae bacterium]
MILNQDENELWVLRQEIAETIFAAYENAELSQRAGELLEEYRSKTGSKSRIHRQFVEYYRIMLLEQEGGTDEVLYDTCMAALAITIPEFAKGKRTERQIIVLEQNWKELYLGELELLLLIQAYHLLENMGYEDEALKGYQDILQYAKYKEYEVTEQKNFCTTAFYYLAGGLMRRQNYQKAEECAEEAIALLRATGTSTRLMPEFFLMVAECEEQIHLGETEKGRQYFLVGEVLREYLDSLDPIRHYTDLHPRYSDCEAYAFKDVLRSRRKYIGISREKLAEIVGCSVATISRAERGEHSPQYDVSVKILEEIGLSGESCSSYFVLGQLEAYDTFHAVHRAISERNPGKARGVLEQLKEQLDCKKKMNQQLVEELEVTIQKMEGKIEGEAVIKEYERLLTYTLGEYRPEKIKGTYLTFEEQAILIDMALTYKRMGNHQNEYHERMCYHKKACEILETLQGERSKHPDHIKLAGWLGDYLGDFGRYEESNQIISECRSIAAKAKENWFTGNLLFTEAWNREQIVKKGKNEKVTELYYVSYLFFALFFDVRGKRMIETQCRNENDSFLKQKIEEFTFLD